MESGKELRRESVAPLDISEASSPDYLVVKPLHFNSSPIPTIIVTPKFAFVPAVQCAPRNRNTPTAHSPHEMTTPK